MRIRIQNAVKMTVKKFFFPCMKNIIFEVIYMLILNTTTAITMDYDVVDNIIEIINVNGMSLNKFRRILRMLITDFFLFNEFFYVHHEKLCLLSEKQFT